VAFGAVAFEVLCVHDSGNVLRYGAGDPRLLQIAGRGTVDDAVQTVAAARICSITVR
jgi:hypothetical protein